MKQKTPALATKLLIFVAKACIYQADQTTSWRTWLFNNNFCV